MIHAFFEIGLSNAILATLLALVVAVVAGVCRRGPIVHVLWLLVLVKLVTPPLWHVPFAALPAIEPSQIATEAATVPHETSHDEALGRQPIVILSHGVQPPTGIRAMRELSAPSEIGSWIGLVALFWLTGTALWFATAAVRVVRFSQLLKRTRSAPDALQSQARQLALRMGLQRCPEIRLIGGNVPPLLWGLLWQPVILLPGELLARLEHRQQLTLLAHELAHIYRRDHWTRRLELIVLGLYWWHPVVWWARRQLQRAEEECCDAWVVWLLPDMAREYAETLLTTVEFLGEARPALPVGANGFSAVHRLQRRFEMILQGRMNRRLSWPAKGILGLVMAPLLVLSLEAVSADAPQAEHPPDARQQANDPQVEQPQGVQDPIAADANNRAEEILSARVSCNLKNEPLREFIKQISSGDEPASIVFEKGVFVDGLTIDRLVTIHLEDIRRQSALNVVLKPLGLGYWVERGVIHIACQYVVDDRVVTHKYYVGDLLASRWSRSFQQDPKDQGQNLQNLVVSTVEPRMSWNRRSICLSADHRYLQVEQTEEAHRQVVQLIKQLRRSASERTTGFLSSLKKKASFSFVNMPLDEVIEGISSEYDVNIVLIHSALMHNRAPVTLEAHDVTFVQVLTSLLSQLQLGCLVGDEVVQITSDPNWMDSRVYDVSDLLVRPMSGPVPDSGPAGVKVDFEPLVRQIKAEVLPKTWFRAGGDGEIAEFPNNLSLVITQSTLGHVGVEQFLAHVRHTPNTKPDSNLPEAPQR